MIVTAWNNSEYHTSGAGYGLSVKVKDRDKYFRKEWSSVVLLLEGQGECTVNLSESFWKDVRPCAELRKKEIGTWLRTNKKGSWEKGKPPKMEMESIGGNRFTVKSTR